MTRLRVAASWSSVLMAAGCSATEPQVLSFDCVPPFSVVAPGHVMGVKCQASTSGPAEHLSVDWTSSQPGVARVKPGAILGEITALAPGSTMIIATYGDRAVSFLVTVQPSAAATLLVVPNPIVMTAGGTMALLPGGGPQGFYPPLRVFAVNGDGSDRPGVFGVYPLTVTSSNPSVVQPVSLTSQSNVGIGDRTTSQQTVMAFAAGNAVLTFSFGGVSVDVPVIVAPNP